MTERPILFSAAMVRAILQGRKTQTRRVVKLPHTNSLGAWEPTTIGGENGGRTATGETVPLQGGIWHTRTGDCLLSPHGQPGDRLWVRETHLNWWKLDEANPEGPRVFSHVAAYAADGYELQPGEKWIPSIHMLRAASRITLEITSVRAERLQSISWDDAIAEGIPDPRRAARRVDPVEGCVAQFRALWDGLNAARGHGWDANPWVWRIEFRRIKS
ncbi:hypothetical protein DF109_07775 [Burkholderia stagnalis]|uniref:hypothetical protein n=1 Tax=Burkholderia stagnalis TaxID=1503054 RepID=UPI000F5D0550|nr:hypothetical protein [Burkholderia stagnalis]RQY67239.1 hypothetical protein DF109_07775 [Burkholderia stagnalis]